MLGNRTVILALALTVILVLVAACGADDEPTTPTPSGGGAEPTPTATEVPDDAVLDGTEWLLAGIDGVDIDLQEPITLEFEDGQINGFSGCNTYSGAYTATEAGDFAIPELIQTDMACETGMDLEADYLDALSQSAQYELTEGQRLELAGSDGETLLVFTIDSREALDGTSWTVTAIDGEPVIEGTEVHFRLRGAEINGSGGCNQFGGVYTASDDGAFSVSEMFWTEIGCLNPEGILDQEQAFFAALSEITTYRLDADKEALTLVDAGGETRIIAEESVEEDESGMFGNPGWVLTSFRGQEIEDRPVVTIRFDAQQFAGTAGCISYSGPIETTPDGEITRILVTSHDASCDGAGEEQRHLPNEYVETLEEAARFILSDTSLEILDQDGMVLLTYRPAETDHDLEGTIWAVTEVNGEAVIPDSEVTAEFSDGYVLGSAGCNSFGSPYIVPEIGSIAIPPPVMTAMLCQEPEGVMEQEAAFQTALAGTHSYQLADGTLEFLGVNGNALLLFERQR